MRISLSIVFIFCQAALLAQSATESLKQGNKLYEEQKYDEAEVEYRQASGDEEHGWRADFNLGDALYRQGRFEEATEQFSKVVATSDDKEIQAKALHNLGNSLVKQEKLEPAVEAYKKSLRLNPNDNETRYNLAHALKALRQKQQQQKQQQQKQQQNQDQQEPSEYAKKLKERCDALVRNYKFQEAFQLMQEGLKKDKTVSYYNGFIKKLKDVVEIETR